MQMKITDNKKIQPPAPFAFVSANGDTSKATNSSRAHLQEESTVTNPRQRIYSDQCWSAC